MAACVYHFVMNATDWQFLLVFQAALTALSNAMLAYAGYVIRKQDGNMQMKLIANGRDNTVQEALASVMGYAVVGAAVCKWASETVVGKFDFGVEWGVIVVVMAILAAMAYGEGGLMGNEWREREKETMRVYEFL